jgi:hypothetical protein
VCRRFEAAVTFARLKQALGEQAEQLDGDGNITRPGRAALDPTGWCMLVLTLDRDGYYTGKQWPNVNVAYQALSKMTRAALQRIGRIWGPEERTEVRKNGSVKHYRTIGNRWISVVEAHRSGWPHMNLMFWCPELAAALSAEREARLEDSALANAVALAHDAWKKKEPIPPAVRELARGATLIGGRLAEVLTASGWGLQSTAERARDIEAVLAYGVKLVGMHDASVGELAKITQAPMNAPIRFRRLRTGKGFLPERFSNPAVTGCLVRRRRSAEGDWEIQAINAPKDEALIEPIHAARAAELALIEEEESILSRTGGQLPPMPPMRVAEGGKLEPHRVTSGKRAAFAAADDEQAVADVVQEHRSTTEPERVVLVGALRRAPRLSGAYGSDAEHDRAVAAAARQHAPRAGPRAG